jgi:hypothetical protein
MAKAKKSSSKSQPLLEELQRVSAIPKKPEVA